MDYFSNIVRQTVGAFETAGTVPTAQWYPAGNATTVPGVFGSAALTADGTATTRTVATTTLATRQRRLGYTSTNVAGTFAGHRQNAALLTTSGGAANVGFKYVCRFVISDAANVATARMFIGLTSSVVAPSNVDPGSLVQAIGIGHNAGATNLFLYCSNATAGTPINLGVGFPNTFGSANCYQLTLISASATSVIQYEVWRLDNNTRATGTITANVPENTTLLAHRAWRCNNATASAVGLDICHWGVAGY